MAPRLPSPPVRPLLHSLLRKNPPSTASHSSSLTGCHGGELDVIAMAAPRCPQQHTAAFLHSWTSPPFPPTNVVELLARSDHHHQLSASRVCSSSASSLFSSSPSPASSFADNDLLQRKDSTCERNVFPPTSATTWGSTNTSPDSFAHPSRSIAAPFQATASFPDIGPSWSSTDLQQEREPYVLETSQDEGPVSEPVPLVEPTDIYIPVKAFFISRRLFAEPRFSSTKAW